MCLLLGGGGDECVLTVYRSMILASEGNGECVGSFQGINNSVYAFFVC